jgi:hypothetical protein
MLNDVAYETNGITHADHDARACITKMIQMKQNLLSKKKKRLAARYLLRNHLQTFARSR